MPKNIPPTIIYVDRDKVSLCSASHLEPLLFKFTPSMIADLEIVNSDDLRIGLRQFVEQNKIKPGPIVMIISKLVYFEKNYPGPSSPTEEDIENFSQTVPFSATSSKVYKVISGYKQVVLNRDFYEAFRETFEELGFSVTAVVPGFALGQSATADFTADTCRIIYKKMDQIIADSIIGASDSKSFQQQEEAILEKNKTLIYLLIVLIFLGCTAAIYFFLFRKPPPRRPVTRVKTVQVSPSPAPTLIPVASPSAELVNSLTVRILNSSGVVGAGSSLSAQLRLLGFSKITVANSGKIISTNSAVISDLAATTSADFISKFISDHYPGIAPVVNPLAKFDLEINLGKTTP
jgi:hypothetical protein